MIRFWRGFGSVNGFKLGFGWLGCSTQWMRFDEMSRTRLWFPLPDSLKGLKWFSAPTGDKVFSTLLHTEETESEGYTMNVTLGGSGSARPNEASIEVLLGSRPNTAFATASVQPVSGAETILSHYWLTEEQAKTLVQRPDGAWQ